MRQKKTSIDLAAMREWFVNYLINNDNNFTLRVEDIFYDVGNALKDPMEALETQRETLLQEVCSKRTVEKFH